MSAASGRGWPTAEVDVGARTYRVLAFHPSQPVLGVQDDATRRRLEARAGEGLLVLEDEEGGRWHLPVGQGGCLDPHRIFEKELKTQGGGGLTVESFMSDKATYRKERKGFGTKHIVECGDVLVRWSYQKRATGYPYLRGVALKPIHFSGNLADQIGDVLRWAERVDADPDEQADLISARRRQLESRVAQAEKELAQAQKSLDEFAALAK